MFNKWSQGMWDVYCEAAVQSKNASLICTMFTNMHRSRFYSGKSLTDKHTQIIKCFYTYTSQELKWIFPSNHSDVTLIDSLIIHTYT